MKLGRNWERLDMKYNTVKLGEYLYIKGRIGWKGLKKSEYLEASDYRIINGETLTSDGIDWSKAGYISEERYAESPGIMLHEGDILISKDGTIGKIGYVDELEMPSSVASGIFVIRNEQPEIIDTRFIYHFLRSPYFRAFIEMRTEGSVIPHLYQKDFADLDFPLFELDVQKKIASILNSIDDKIALNKKINNNLQQQAQAIFSDMFPDIFTSNSSATLQKMIDFSNGKKRPETLGNIPVYGGNGILAYTDQTNSENCVIIGRVGAYCGNTFLCLGKCWTSDNAIQAKSKNDSSPLFIYYLLKNAALPSRHIGTGQPLMTQGILNSIPINEPPFQTIGEFISICQPIHQVIFANEKENATLSSLRDALLPRLMSGEIDVSDIDL